MKIIELSPVPPTMSALLEAVQNDDVLLVQGGHPLVRIEKFDDDDWDDWKYEHSTEAISRGEAARQQYRDGEFRVLTRDREEAHLRQKKASPSIQLLYFRFKEAICSFGNGISVKPVDRFLGFWVDRRKFANFHIHESSFKIWLGITPGKLKDPRRLTNQTQTGHTLNITDDSNFDYVVTLIKQSYLKKK